MNWGYYVPVGLDFPWSSWNILATLLRGFRFYLLLDWIVRDRIDYNLFKAGFLLSYNDIFLGFAAEWFLAVLLPLFMVNRYSFSVFL